MEHKLAYTELKLCVTELKEHKLAYTELKLCVTDLKLMTRPHFIEILMMLTKYVFYVRVWLTEYSVTVGSVTLRFYCSGDYTHFGKLLVD